MKSLVILSLGLIIAVGMAEAQDSDPVSSPTPAPTSGEIQEPALPAPEATPEDAGPMLLPESNELPGNPGLEQPSRTSINRASTKPSPGETARFDEVQSLAMSNPRAAYLLKRARNSSSGAARRGYLRAYYSTVAARMRKLDPELKGSIDAYEEAKFHEVAGSASNDSYHRSHSHHLATREPHHRSRRVAAHHRHERMMIIYDPYGPYPYGPYLPPYGPPVFDPW
jgi:hypothetical protein